MATPRRQTVNPDVPGVYHALSRCVRRGFLLCGDRGDRRHWVARQLSFVGSLHGLLVILHVGMLFFAKERVPLSTGMTLWGHVGAAVPIGPFIAEVPLSRMLKASGAAARGSGDDR